jgi:2-polyprenyl-6-methoxyphenol hydroxylase-like FAD-dependent oxidoreductase
MLLSRDGHDVTVLEKDIPAPPARGLEAWEQWERSGVAQFRQVHALHARVRHLLDAEFPDVRARLEFFGGRRLSLFGGLPATVEDRASRPGDERFETISARRPVLEGAFAQIADETPGLRILRGVTVESLQVRETTADGVPHVVGVQTKDGERYRADLIVDAMGRRSRFTEWVTAVGARPPKEESSDTGFAYYTRHYRARNGSMPELTGLPFTNCSTLSIITLPADNDTWAIAIVCMAGDSPLKEIRRNDVHERVVRSVPHLEPWLEGEPLHDVFPMAGAMDRYRRFVVDDKPVVTGLVAVGDSWACTNPTAGRGLSLGLAHAVALRDLLRSHLDDPYRLAIALDKVTEEQLTPWYRQQMDRDSDRVAAVNAAIEGREPPKPDLSEPIKQIQQSFFLAAQFDPEVARAFSEVLSVLALPKEILARPGMIEKVMDTASGREMPETPGPSREELLRILAGSD